jgi:hypothetical protein
MRSILRVQRRNKNPEPIDEPAQSLFTFRRNGYTMCR